MTKLDLSTFQPKHLTTTTAPKAPMNIRGSIQMSKGVTTYKDLYLVVLENPVRYFLLQSNVGIPRQDEWCDLVRHETTGYKTEVVSERLFRVFEDSIGDWVNEGRKSHLVPYSYVYGYVKGRTGMGLEKLWSFELGEDDEG